MIAIISNTIRPIIILGGAIPPQLVEAAGTWNHEGRDYWPKQFPYCDGKRQSPININNQDVKLETDVNDLKFPRYDLVRVQILLTRV